MSFKVFTQEMGQRLALWGLLTGVFVAYWLTSRQFVGPAYLSDEIGYLTKAAAFAGFPVDMASSWHGGYSLLLMPLFKILSNPFLIWQGIMALNALMWVASLFLLFHLLRKLFPTHSFWTVLLATATSALYPAWMSMSGYAFSTSGFVFVFMLALTCFVHSYNNKANWLTYSFLVGYLYWVHPTGMAVAAASLISVALLTLRTRAFAKFIAHASIVVSMLLAYKFGVHPWLSDYMTPEHYTAQNHYQNASQILGFLQHIPFWIKWLITSLGHLTYVLIATLGLAAYAAMEVYRRLTLVRKAHLQSRAEEFTIFSMLLALLSCAGVIFLGAFAFSLIPTYRVDHWIYGRYTEAVLLPVIGIGFLSAWQFRHALSATLIVIGTGIVFLLFTNELNATSDNNLVNVQGFWPHALLPHGTHFKWFIVGSLGIMASYVLGAKLLPVILIPAFVLSIVEQVSWHQSILANYSKPTSLISFVRDNFPPGTCVGFNPELPPKVMRERRQLYAFYLYDYDYRRMSPEEWKSQCDGPYLTHSVDLVNSEESLVIAREYKSRLFVVIKPAIVDGIDATLLNEEDYYVDLSGRTKCLVGDCFRFNIENLIAFSKVGQLADNSLATIGKRGYLFFGPYYQMGAGDYLLELEVQVNNTGEADLDIVSHKGRTTHMGVSLSRYLQIGHNTVQIPFSLREAVNDFEVRLHVSEGSSLSVSSYLVRHNDGELMAPRVVPSNSTLSRDTLPKRSAGNVSARCARVPIDSLNTIVG